MISKLNTERPAERLKSLYGSAFPARAFDAVIGDARCWPRPEPRTQAKHEDERGQEAQGQAAQAKDEAVLRLRLVPADLAMAPRDDGVNKKALMGVAIDVWLILLWS